MTQTDQATLFDYLNSLQLLDGKKLLQVWENANHDQSAFIKSLVDQELLNEEELGKLIAAYYSVPYINLKQIAISNDVLNLIPELVAKKNQVVAFLSDQQGLHIATNSELDPDFVAQLAKKAGQSVVLHYATKSSLDQALSLYAIPASQAFDQILHQSVANAKNAKAESAPIIQLVDTIIDYAFNNNASDIHLEPEEDYMAMRFRIDGVLHDIYSLPVDISQQIVTRIKVMAKLRTDEHQAPQDGKIAVVRGNEPLDLRVSIVPVTTGEKVVMRLLSSKDRQLSLTDLGVCPMRSKIF